ncbi:MAG: hypothetical protein WKF66_17105 [Pedobacter sp.]
MKLTSNLSLVLLMCLPLAFACKKSGEPSEKPVVAKKVLSRIIHVDNDNKTSFSVFNYDEKVRLKSVTNGSTTDVYRYDGEDLSYVEYWLGTNKTENTVSYVDKKPVKTVRKMYNTGTLVKEMTMGYIYGTGNYPTEIHVTEAGIVQVKEKYQYSANSNVTRIESQSNVLIITEFTYDNNKNRFTNSMLGYTIYGEPYDRLSPNNVLKEKIIYPDGSYLEINNTYTYDADGFPVTRVSKALHSIAGNVGTEKYTYEYQML